MSEEKKIEVTEEVKEESRKLTEEELAQFLLQKDETEHIEADIPKKDDIWALQTNQEKRINKRRTDQK